MKSFRLGFLLVGLIWLSISESQSQQIPQYSQYMFNPVFINPAYTGYKQQLYLQSYYRKQWTGVNGGPETFSIAGDSYLEENKLGIGGQLVTDKLGAQRSTAVYGNLAYHLQLTDNKVLSFGAGVGLVNGSLDGSMLNPRDDGDPNVPIGKDQVFYPDLKLGLFFYSDRYYVGLAADQMISPFFDLDNGDVMIDPVQHVYLSGGGFFDISYNFSLAPSLMYMDDFKAPSRLDLNLSLVYNDRIWLGGGYRTGIHMPGRDFQDGLKKSTAVIAMVQVFALERLRFGYAYDHNLSGFSVTDFTSHEISVGYLFPPKRVRMVSPRFF